MEVTILKDLIGFEIRKSMKRPVVFVVLAIIFLYNILMIFQGSFDEPGYGTNPYSRERVNQLRQEQSEFTGFIDDEWIQNVEDIKNDILYNPANQISEEERKEKTEELLARGLSREMIDSNIIFFIREEVLYSRELQRLEEPGVAGNFYKSANRIGQEKATHYREVYDGEKGEALATKAEEMYGYLSKEYRAYYAYSWGWSRLHAMKTVLPYTVGLLLIVILAPLFSKEYARKTDSLILSTKHGKNKVIKAKIITAFLLSILSWMMIQFINIGTIFTFFGTEGARSFLQNWALNPSPYPFTYLTSYLVVTGMSFLGLIFLTSTILFISSRSKGSASSLVTAGIVTLLPIILAGIFGEGIVKKIIMFMPANVLVAVDHFKTFDAFYILDKVIMLPFATAFVAVTLSIFMVIGAYFSFKRHQVEN
ncbi:ABC-2 family transporter protein [Clostridium aceticum]|uniref:ABC-2 family transporter protein n=1 Tax=Clostridium aceticum TaxID=84022 RepID=A0A0D8IBK4_9CLOT|nr:ABC transporter permease subunit [Clostridium aceticum]AKL96496.1 ABC-2 family transporter protein [Clostridium aceticum]KJF27332.1 hypothetical protein TZ02_08325 [Clostridium aceticum]